jgi:hypothetical protein
MSEGGHVSHVLRYWRRAADPVDLDGARRTQQRHRLRKAGFIQQIERVLERLRMGREYFAGDQGR